MSGLGGLVGSDGYYIAISYWIIIIFHKSYGLMFKLWRREASKNVVPDAASKKRQAQFMEHLSQAIKLLRKKQQFYTRILFVAVTPMTQTSYPTCQSFNRSSLNTGIRQHTSYSGLGNCQSVHSVENHIGYGVDVWSLQSEADGLLHQEDEIISNIRIYEGESFFMSKKFLYSIFVRMLEIFQFARQTVLYRIKNEDKIYCRSWEKMYEDNKLTISDCYQNLVYFQNFNLLQLITTAFKKQNNRIFSIVPARIKKNQISLKPLIGLNSTELRKTHSVDMKSKKEDIAEIISKKLTVKEKKMLFTEKRIEERKKVKQKPLTFKQLYNILNAKLPKIQQNLINRRQLQLDALERNTLIQEQRKKWQKKCEQRTRITNQ